MRPFPSTRAPIRPFALVLTLTLALLISACDRQGATVPVGEDAPRREDGAARGTGSARRAAGEAPAPELGSFGVDLSAMDPTVAPGDDFFRYVNGAWLDAFEIPEGLSTYGSFTVLFERSEARVRAIIEDAARSDAPPGSLTRKIGDYFTAFTDLNTIEARGLDPIALQLSAYDGMATHAEVARAMADPSLTARRPFSISVEMDPRAPAWHAVVLSQGGLGLPSPAHYLDPAFKAARRAYGRFLEDMLRLVAADPGVKERAAAVLDLETALANVHWRPAKAQNPALTDNRYTIRELMAYAPGIDWRLVFDTSEIGARHTVIARQNDALKATAALFAETPTAVWRDYLTIHALSENAAVLPRSVGDAKAGLFAATGRAAPPEARWKRGIGAVNDALGEGVGRLYVERHFPPSAKAQMEDLVATLKAAFAARLDTVDWMDAETKGRAREKLAKFRTKIGYPDRWTDYSGLEVRPDDAFGNLQRARRFAHDRMIARIGRPVDRDAWVMTPQTVNAYYAPDRNEIVFPAAILQAPFFDPAADPAVNYGAIGAVIGHEISHGFDGRGRRTDGDGLLRDWWTRADAESYAERASALGAQYAAYATEDGRFVNPALTMVENIGDLGGVALAHEAWRMSLDGSEAPEIAGFSGDQRFFLAWGQIWRRKYRADALRRRLMTDPHAPSAFRTNGVVRNITPWYDAFGVDEADALYLPPEARVSIW